MTEVFDKLNLHGLCTVGIGKDNKASYKILISAQKCMTRCTFATQFFL